MTNPISSELQQQISNQVMEAMVKQGINNFQPDSPQAPQSTIEMPQDKSIVTTPMDTDETLRMENLFLREQMEKMHKQLEEMRRELASRTIDDAKKGLHSYLYEKHEVDAKTHILTLDAKARTVTIAQRTE